jgi:hypothetical protein
MNCQGFETIVNDLARAQMIEASTRDEALRHSAECRVCAARLKVEGELTGMLHELSVINHSATISANVEARLLAEFRRQQSQKSVVQTSRRRYTVYAAVAAVLLLAFAVIGYQTLLKSEKTAPVVQSTTSDGPPVVEVKQRAPVPASSPESRKKTAPRNVASKRGKGTQPRSTAVDNRATLATNHRDEVVSEFIPIGYASAANVEDGGQLVRIEMPRSAMARFGLPVNMERYNERVKADVLVSADGLARAIRFVQ